ncbi:MAG TPA: polyprenyl synthetase family protein [Clostridiales bacterium]|nr:polyprenyl synthetase family protein [Clostridiales bacterium]
MANVEEILANKRILLKTYLTDWSRGKGTLLREAMSYTLGNGGKRLRPSLFLLTADLYGKDSENLLPFAAGLEMIHTYSLIHDDLPAMDNDAYRRGKPTNHKVYGEGQAILAGDALLSEAFYLMASLKETEPAERVLDALRYVADYAGLGGMVYGQSLDLLGEGKMLTVDALKEIHFYKTGALLSLAFVCGAVLGGAPQKDVEALDGFGRSLGLAFQITDDILDHEGTFAELGKPIGSDEVNGKSTYISLLGLAGARAAGKQAVAEAIGEIASLSVDSTVLRDLGKVVLNRKK